MGSMESSCIGKDKESLHCCQASGREVRIIHHCETLYLQHDPHPDMLAGRPYVFLKVFATTPVPYNPGTQKSL